MNSEELFARATTLLPGGVSSPVRAIRPYPFYTIHASGSRLHTVDGATLIDCCMAYGPLLLGHAHPEIQNAIRSQIEHGWIYGTPTPSELELATLITRDHPGSEMVRFVSTGGEATMAALRLARGYTGRMDVIKIEGGFHGAHDAVLVKAGSGATTIGVPDSAGVVPDLVSHTLQVPFNDAQALEDMLHKHREVAALIIEPVMGNIGPVLPEKGYLRDIREITRAYDVLLIFDEVITGYRLGIGGAQVSYGVRPDLTTLGKIVGGGLPMGILCGGRAIMNHLSPSGTVYQAGTFNGNPLSLGAGIATLRWIHSHRTIYQTLDANTRFIGEQVKDRHHGSFVSIGSMFKYFFRPEPPKDYHQAKESDTARFKTFWGAMMKQGVFLPPSQFETNFLSTAHTEQEIESIGAAYRTCL